MSRQGGSERILLREATRQAGVTARAAYRHFADRQALVHAVAEASLTRMAAAIDRQQVGAEDGAALLHAVGAGYIEFAMDEPGWFDVALFAMSDLVDVDTLEADPARSPYQQLHQALGVIVAEGGLPATGVKDAAIMCWSGVHGFATLVTRGPMRQLPRPQIDRAAEQLVVDLVHAVLHR